MSATSFVPGPPPPLSATEQRALTSLAADVRPLCAPVWWVPVAAALSEWAVIAAAVASTWWIAHPAWWAAVALLVGARQHGLLILMHEGVHRRVHPRADVNDWISDLLFAWPLFASTEAYRQSHLLHHRHLHTPRDPDWQIRHDRPEWAWPASRGRLALRLLAMALGGGIVAFFRADARLRELRVGLVAPEPQPLRRFARLVVTLAIPAIAVASGQTLRLLALWVLPFLTVLPLLVRLRVIAEHYGLPATNTFDTTRDWTGGGLADWLLVPWNIRLHLTHHLFPAVPFHRLGAAQRRLHADPVVGPRCHRTRSLGQLVSELTSSTSRERATEM